MIGGSIVKLKLIPGLALALTIPSQAQAQGAPFVGDEGCGDTFLSACASLQSAVFNSGILTLVVANTSDPILYPDVFIGTLLLKFDPNTPLWLSSEAIVVFNDNNDVSLWSVNSVSGQPGGFHIGWDTSVGDPSNSQRRVKAGDTVTITMLYQVDGTDYEVTQWAAHMQGLPGGESDWTTTSVVPEPMTVALLGSGLLGIGLVQLRRRKKGNLA